MPGCAWSGRPNWLAHDRNWLAAHYVPLACLVPENSYAAAIEGDPEFQVMHRRVASEFLPLSAMMLAELPELLLFFRHAGGVMFQTAILRAGMDDPEGRFAAISYAEVGDRFGYSRTQVRRVLQDAEAAGLLRLPARGGRHMEILPPLWAGYDRASPSECSSTT